MNLTDFLRDWRHSETIMILNGRIGLDNFLQILLPYVKCSVTWCRIAQTCKTAHLVCDRLLKRYYDEIGRETSTCLPCGKLHGLKRTWYHDKWNHQLETSAIYTSGKLIKKTYREWSNLGYLKYAVDKDNVVYTWYDNGPDLGKLKYPRSDFYERHSVKLNYIKELPDHLR